MIVARVTQLHAENVRARESVPVVNPSERPEFPAVSPQISKKLNLLRSCVSLLTSELLSRHKGYKLEE